MPGRLDSKSKTGASVAGSRKRRSAAGAWLSTLLLCAGIVLLAVFAAARIDRLFTSRTLLKTMPAVNSLEPLDQSTTAEDTRMSLRDDSAGSDAKRSNPDKGPLAVLRIPKIHLEVPVLDGTDALTLNHAAGRIEGTALPGEAGNIGIGAHRDSFFRNLGKLRVGDSLELQTSTGTDIYIVDGTQVVMPTDVSVLDPTPTPSLTLVTCYPFGHIGKAPQRYIVTASLAQPERGQPSPVSR